MCWSLWLTRGGRDAASQPRRLSKPTLATATGRRRRRLSSSRCCLFHKRSQTTKSEKAASAYGSRSTTGEKRGRCPARNPPTPKRPPRRSGLQPHGKRGQRHQRKSLQLIAEYTEAKYTTRDEHSNKVWSHEQVTPPSFTNAHVGTSQVGIPLGPDPAMARRTLRHCPRPEQLSPRPDACPTERFPGTSPPRTRCVWTRSQTQLKARSNLERVTCSHGAFT